MAQRFNLLVFKNENCVLCSHLNMNWIICIDPKPKHYTFFHHSDLLSCVKFHKKLLSSPLDSWSSVKLLYSCCLTVTPKFEFVFACLKATLTDIVSNSLKVSLLTSLSYCNNFKNLPVLIVLSSSTLNGLFLSSWQD